MLRRVFSFNTNRLSITPTSKLFNNLHFYSTKTSDKPNNPMEDKTSDDQQVKVPLGLPAPGDSDSTQVEVGGTSFKLDALGPVVVNEDGTISRIDNWKEMTEIERKNVNRILLKRNKERLEKLKAQLPTSTQ
ncbi:hypothetical protein K7432_009683 [Basidiobolus ranarum]|uniref:Uncharacterized protein n=1 Tax=Basidiobolus ranarum TaxID=34480 RepID=A0ABR2WPU4_9FUNG